MPGHLSPNSPHRDDRSGDYGRPGREVQPCVTTVADVELLAEIGLDEAGAITLGRRQIGMLYEGDKAFLSEFVLAGFPSRLGNRLATTGGIVPLVQFRG